MRKTQKHILRSFLFLLLCGALGACNADGLGGTSDGGGPDGGGARACSVNQPAPSCCDGAGRRIEGASCGSTREWTCANGSLCRCGGVEATFVCADGCGSDAFTLPVCFEGAWTCPKEAPVRTDSCPANTCWGEPGDCRCCANDGSGPRVRALCFEAMWTCPAGTRTCNTCD